MKADPILSVVIPSFNSEKYLEECLKSLQSEKCRGVEYVFVDGGSTDNTMEIVEPYRDLFSVIISERDKGQSDAFNKGFAKSKGRYITWLNSDDVLCPGSLKKVVDVISARNGRWYAANCVYINSDSKITRCCQSGRFERLALYFGILNVFGPSTILRRDLFYKSGKFIEDFHYCMDTEYWWRLVTLGEVYERIPIYFWALRLHDDAKTASAITGKYDNRPLRMQEEGALLGEMYYPQRSKFKRHLGLLYVRMLRILNGSYVRSTLDTRRAKGLIVSEFSN